MERDAGQPGNLTATEEREARLFARYLVDGEGLGEHHERYHKAIGTLGIGEGRFVPLVRRRPFLLGIMDAGCGIVRPSDPLRQRLLVMAAVLEASPHGTEKFLSQPRFFRPLLLLCLAKGFLAGLKAVVGVPLVLLLGRGR